MRGHDPEIVPADFLYRRGDLAKHLAKLRLEGRGHPAVGVVIPERSGRIEAVSVVKIIRRVRDDRAVLKQTEKRSRIAGVQSTLIEHSGTLNQRRVTQ